MPHFMLQLAYHAHNWEAQLEDPQDRIETVAKPVLEEAGCKLISGWYTFGQYDMLLIIEAPDAATVMSIPMAVSAGGALEADQVTPLLSGPEAVVAMKKAAKLASVYKPAGGKDRAHGR